MNAMARMPVAPQEFIAAMGLAATGVSVVTTDGPAGRFGLTVSAVSSVSAEPPLVLVCINRKSPAMAAVEGNGQFAVNLLGAGHRAYAETFSGRPREGKPFDFANHEWRLGETGLPLVRDATAVFECETASTQAAGDHELFIGRVRRLVEAPIPPLVFQAGHYRLLGEVL